MTPSQHGRRALGAWLRPGRALALAAAFLALPFASQAQSVSALACVPAVIGGGSGATSTCTVRLGAPAPAGGAVVTLASSLTALAASVPRVTVAAGQTSANFAVATNARYRLGAGLPFNVVISASRGTTASASLNVTAPPRPADFSSGVPPGARFPWQGSVCGGIGPVGGSAGVLYQCSGPTGTSYGSCTLKQECSLGCRRVPVLITLSLSHASGFLTRTCLWEHPRDDGTLYIPSFNPSRSIRCNNIHKSF